MRAIIAVHVFLLSLVLTAIAALAQPTVSIFTDSENYEAGAAIEVSIAGENSGDAAYVDVHVGLITRDGAIYTLNEGGWSDAMEPWFADVYLPSPFSMGPNPFGRFDLPCAMPPMELRGQYCFAAALTRPGTLEFVGEPSLAPFYYHGVTDIEMIVIPAGSFVMGSPEYEQGRRDDEGPRRTVSISAFSMSETEVTQKQWQLVMGWNDSFHEKDDSFAIEHATWLDCVAFCNRLSDIEHLNDCYIITNIAFDEMHIVAADVTCDFAADGYRLPTEAEWEYACRAGTAGRFNTGDADSDLARAAWYSETSDYELKRVGQKEPNAFSLFDMHGNNWEWCWDWYDTGYYGSRPEPDNDPRGPASGSARIYRGGGFGSPAWCCRSALRGRCSQGTMCVDLGFRVARSVQ